jgi:hypothetical protein
MPMTITKFAPTQRVHLYTYIFASNGIPSWNADTCTCYSGGTTERAIMREHLELWPSLWQQSTDVKWNNNTYNLCLGPHVFLTPHVQQLKIMYYVYLSHINFVLNVKLRLSLCFHHTTKTYGMWVYRSTYS